MFDAIPVSLLVIIAIVVLYLLNSIKILREYERGVIFRLGRVLGAPKARHHPGIPAIDQMVRLSLRQECWRFQRRTLSPATTLR